MVDGSGKEVECIYRCALLIYYGPGAAETVEKGLNTEPLCT